MTLLSVLFVALSVLLLLAPAPSRSFVSRLASDGEGSLIDEGPPQSRRRWWALLLLALLSLGAVHRWSGTASAVLGLAVLMIVSTCLRLVLQHRRSAQSLRARAEVAHACEVLASQIKVGRVPAEALSSAAVDCRVLGGADRAQELGGDVVDVWRQRAQLPGHGGLIDLARAWQVSQQTGAPMAKNLDQVSEALSAEQALRTVVAGELSAPRATGKIMAVLPFCGLGMGYVLGGDPVAFLLSSAYGWACLLGGVGLAAAGVLWIDRLARLAAEQE